MPNTNIPIVSSKKVSFEEISVCLISANQTSEKKIYSKLKNNIKFKGDIFSIFPTSKYFFLGERKNI